MSTFNGIVNEFPNIAIDFFRRHPGRPPPLACFLSHVHSDHLAGLEAFRSPFVYCSAATREILLRLEKQTNRIAFANKVREAPVRTYKHLRSLLKPIPLETPTVLELEPGNRIQVTLLDANHCPGAVMFLIESKEKAVLYTGDIRSEPWWVNSLSRNPNLVHYSSGLKSLDRIYLDTSMLNDDILQTKAEGLIELLRKVSEYPDDTVFYLQAWTYGYEEVWIALSKALNSKIHVDEYKMGIYKSLVAKSSQDRYATQFHHAKGAPSLIGFSCGNNQHDGCLTLDENVRIHSCEKGTSCLVLQNKPVVWIQPIISHLPNGQDILEVGFGGGGDDLEQDVEFQASILENTELLVATIDGIHGVSAEVREQMKSLLSVQTSSNSNISPALDITDFTEDLQTRLGSVIWSIAKSITASEQQSSRREEALNKFKGLPNKITFPYARHSSLPELRHLVDTFKPKDIWPCTVDIPYWIEHKITMRGMFGPHCAGSAFGHDDIVDRIARERSAVYTRQRPLDVGSQQMASSSTNQLLNPATIALATKIPGSGSHAWERQNRTSTERFSVLAADPLSNSNFSDTAVSVAATLETATPQVTKRTHEAFRENESQLDDEADDPDLQGDSQATSLSATAYETRLRAFRAVDDGHGDWSSIGLISTTGNHSTLDEELGR